MITDKHRGHDIEFNISTEEWKCGDLALSNKSLAKLKAAIDVAAKERRRVRVPAYFLDERYRGGRYVHQIKKVTIVLLREGDRKADIKIDGDRGQQQVGLEELFPLDQKPNLEAFVAAKKREAMAEEEATKLHEDMNRMTAEAVREAVVKQAEESA
jgi:hypothetical protein